MTLKDIQQDIEIKRPQVAKKVEHWTSRYPALTLIMLAGGSSAIVLSTLTLIFANSF